MTDFEYVVRLSTNADSKCLSLLLRQMFVERGVTSSFDQSFPAEMNTNSSKVWCYVACIATTGDIVAFCLFYKPYSTWIGVSLAISDIFVQEDHRRRGLCRSLIQAVLNHDKRRHIQRLDMQVPQSSDGIRSVLEKFNFENISSSMGWLDFILTGSALQKVVTAKQHQGVSINGIQEDCGVYIRPATPADAPDILRFIHGLASYQGLAERVEMKSDILSQDLEDDCFICCLAIDATKNTAIGSASSFLTFSAEHGFSIHIEDLFLDEDYRGKGIGRALIQASSQIAIKMGVERVDLQVHRTNLNAKGVYQKIGFVDICDSTPIVDYRLEDSSLEALKLAERNPHVRFS